jgi:hypothetical protein
MAEDLLLVLLWCAHTNAIANPRMRDVADSPAPSRAPSGAPGATRRTALTVGLYGLGAMFLTACSDDAEPGTREPATRAGLAPDVAVATRALGEIRAVRAAVTQTISRFPDSRATIGPLVAMHRTHEATLVDAVPDRAQPSATPAPYVVPRKREKALARIVAREQRLHATLDDLAVQAQSGQFARLLASMGTAVHQRLAVGSA